VGRFNDFPPGIDPSGKRWPVHAPKELDRDRALGALMGLAVGDALGTTQEFTRPNAPALPALADGPQREMVGEGPFGVAPGQVTDDTQMAACLSQSLMACGLLDPDEVAARYVKWSAVAFDIGNQTRAALDLVAEGVSPEESGRRVWLSTTRRAAGNGSLMRTTPIGLFAANRPENRRMAATLDSAVTHYDPRCQLACALHDAAVAAATLDRADAAGMVAAARAELGPAAQLLRDKQPEDAADVDSAVAELERDLAAAAQPDPLLYGPEIHLLDQQGFVRVAFRLSFWHLQHATSFEAALVDVVNRGGDSDTNGAITGALLGARFGEAAIPERWRARVMSALDGGDSPFATDYHPRALLALVK
jgi:ADP-ribosyl-[dinitrogen reductase] hydrolase